MTRSPKKNFMLPAIALTLVCAIALTPAPRINAADHADAPYVNGDQSVDGADTYAFLDPTDNTRVILAMTFRGFIAAGENRNFGQFDPSARHRFEIDINGDPRPDRFINVTFSRRTGSVAPQVATVTLMNGQTFTANTTPPSTCIMGSANCPPPATITDLGTTGVRFFAGMRDDTFNFDIPAFNNFVSCVTTPNALPSGETCPSPVTNIFQRGRDTFAGYSIMNIALSIPRTVLTAAGVGNSFGVQAVHQRRSPTRYLASPDQVASGRNHPGVGFGEWVTLDRVGNPGINATIIPFIRKDEFNAATPQDDANGRFRDSLVGVFRALGTTDETIAFLADAVITRGDLLRLNLSTPNTSLGFGEQIYSPPTGGYTGFPNGRRPHDDVVDTLLFLIANFPAGGLSDNANINEVPQLTTFPFFPPPHQPRPAGAGAEDLTRN